MFLCQVLLSQGGSRLASKRSLTLLPIALLLTMRLFLLRMIWLLSAPTQVSGFRRRLMPATADAMLAPLVPLPMRTIVDDPRVRDRGKHPSTGQWVVGAQVDAVAGATADTVLHHVVARSVLHADTSGVRTIVGPVHRVVGDDVACRG